MPSQSRSSRTSARRTRACIQCGLFGHASHNCPEPCDRCGEVTCQWSDCLTRLCFWCLSATHDTSHCPRRCGYCRQVDHTTSNCPRACRYCRTDAHTTTNCPRLCQYCRSINHSTSNCPRLCQFCRTTISHSARNCPLHRRKRQ